MQFGAALGTACVSFAVTNIDDMFVLVTFFAEASTSKILSPFKITLGQYIGFTAIIVISMIGFGAAIALPAEPIGFLGLLPILLGVWKSFDIFFQSTDDETEQPSLARIRSTLKVSLVTLMNGGDNIGVYVPLFSQAKGAAIAVYVITYYILIGVWCLIAYLVMKQKHILRVVQKHAIVLIPLLYVGIGIYIIVKSSCYPWSIERIDDATSAHTGEIILSVVTTVLLLTCIGAMLWFKLRKSATQPTHDNDTSAADDPTSTTEVSDSRGSVEDVALRDYMTTPDSDRTRVMSPIDR